MDIDSDSDYRASDSEDDRSSIDPPPAASPVQHRLPIRRKRRASGGLVAAPAEPSPSPPRKRAKGDFNAAYLSLLNRDIQDASSGLIHGEEDVVHPGSGSEHTTQIGVVEWNPAERNAFFAAVSRRGRGDVGGVSARIATKSEVEVQQYLSLLESTGQRRRWREGEEKGKGRGKEKGGAPRLVDIPAAVEIGPECSFALETAADALSLRQESYEEGEERKRWGSRWRVTASLARTLEESLHGRQGSSATTVLRPQVRVSGEEEEEQQSDEEDSREQKALMREERKERARVLDEMPFLDLFSLQNWIHLSDCVFMNSAVSDGNWRAVSEEHEPPAIQATALAHFHRVVVGVVKRLLSVAMYMAESRIRKGGSDEAPKRAKPTIRVEDVVAAASSLDMKRDSREFWARCARRLRLNVVNDETGEDDTTDRDNEDTDTDSSEDTDGSEDTDSSEDTGGDEHLGSLKPGAVDIEAVEHEIEETEEDDYEIMSYDEVEAALGYPVNDIMRNRPNTPETVSEHISDASEQDTGEEGHGEDYSEDDDQHEGDIKMEDGQEPAQDESDDELDPNAIQQDLEEAVMSLVSVEHAGAASSRRVLKTRIRAEHRLERDAERLDLQAGADAEKKLWAVLRGDDSGSRPRPCRSRNLTRN
ncbi:hypothetical protein F5Y14DRAFT_405645 [Nemania sp. NC0429]|nr:hypothetical protein F5Y14DRAFT_405645 [Nemania sp. NC0429]